MTAGGRRVVAGCVAVWAAWVIWVAVAGILGGGRVPVWLVSVTCVASALVGYTVCGLLNHSP